MVAKSAWDVKNGNYHREVNGKKIAIKPVAGSTNVKVSIDGAFQGELKDLAGAKIASMAWAKGKTSPEQRKVAKALRIKEAKAARLELASKKKALKVEHATKMSTLIGGHKQAVLDARAAFRKDLAALSGAKVSAAKPAQAAATSSGSKAKPAAKPAGKVSKPKKTKAPKAAKTPATGN
jgi:hypothetical protein